MTQLLPDSLLPGFSRRIPRKIALLSEGRQVTYLELEKQSNRIANFLKSKPSRSPRVALLLDRSPELIEAIVGVLKSDSLFVPLSPSFPPDRVGNLMTETQPGWVITSSGYFDKFKDVLPLDRCNLLVIDETGPLLEMESERLIFDRVYDENCYIYFTSGSTGTPKGVLGQRRGLAHFIHWEIAEFGIGEDSRVSQWTPPSFDPYLRDIFVPLCAGGTCCIPAGDTLLDMKNLIRWIDDSRVNLVHTVPAIFKKLVPEIEDPGCFRKLKYILLAGELLRGRDVKPFIELFADRIQLVNIYGPTETTLAKFFHPITGEDINRAVVPVGKPIEGAGALILDGKRRKCRPGKKGEIYIRTSFRSAGYFNDQELTKRVFIQNPFSDDPGDIIYKTGDLGRLLPGGDVELSGRVDFQVKIRGVRIEPAEIENILLRHRAVAEALVTVTSAGDGDKALCAYFIARGPAAGSPPPEALQDELREYVASQLPAPMVPTHFLQLEKMPLGANGKIDRSALPEPGRASSVPYVSPRDARECKLVEIWSEVLRMDKEKIGIDDNFFQLGGHSLNATSISHRIDKEFQVKLPLRHIFEKTSIRELSRCVEELALQGGDKYVSLEPVEKKEYYELSSIQKRLYFIHQLDEENVGYNMFSSFFLDGKPVKEHIQETAHALIRRHEILRTSLETVAGEPVQRVYNDVDFHLACYEAGEDGIPGIIKQFIKPFDLTRPPLMRMGLIDVKGRNQVLLIVDMHHIITDAFSNRILAGDFATLFSGEELPPMKLQYKDFCHWQNLLNQGGGLVSQEKFWLRQFTGELPELNLPVDFPGPAPGGACGSTLRFTIDGERARELREFALERGATLQVFLLSVFYILLAKISGQEDIIVGTPVTGRRHADLENIIGVFVNTLALRGYPVGEKTFLEFLDEIKALSFSAYENQEYPFDSLVNKVWVNRSRDKNPLFDVMFEILSTGREKLGANQLTSISYRLENQVTKMPIDWYGIETLDCLHFIVFYNQGMFKQESIRKLTERYMEIIDQVLADMELRLKDIKVTHSYIAAKPVISKEAAGDFGF